MSEKIIEVKNLSKKFTIGLQSADFRTTVQRSIKKWTKTISGKAMNLSADDFWALRNISFTVSKGESIGIIGKNGAGKTTLLKIMSRITPPTTGEIILRGQIASLLEVGAGFHGELSGRENVFLNGAIIGMNRKEIMNKFDSIINFAQIRKFLDTPVKRFSSGMIVRLAFAVATHFDSDILVFDEILSVADLEFQKKCLHKINLDLKKGKTIFFVSQNLNAVKKICNRVILMDKGELIKDGNTREVVAKFNLLK